MDAQTVDEATRALRVVLGRKHASDFCGCCEGDIDHKYPDACTVLLKEFETELSQAGKVMAKIRRIEHVAKFLDQVGSHDALNRLDHDLQTVLDGRCERNNE